MQLLTLILVFTFSFSALACPESWENMQPMDTAKVANKSAYQFASYKTKFISQERWNKVLDEIEQIYNYHLMSSGIKLKIHSLWDDPRINATVRRTGNIWRVIIFGGYATSPYIDSDVLARVACHEIGHHMGGTVFYSGKFNWAAGEGPADYFSTLKCLRKYFADKDNAMAVAKLSVPSIVRKKCSQAWKDLQDQLICMRSSMAAKNWTILMYNNDSYQFNTPDPRKVNTTKATEPSPQCRLDTHFQGALCPVDDRINLDSNDPKVGACNGENFQVGKRPRCWYRPNL